MTESDRNTQKKMFYDKRTQFIQLWEMNSQELFEAAEAVWNSNVIETKSSNGKIYKHFQLYRPASLLMGLCLEVLLKGLIIKNEKLEFPDGKLTEDLATHNLVNLFNRAGISLKNTYEELELAKSLSDSVEWVSKYPIPKKYSKVSRAGSKNPLRRNDFDFDSFQILRNKVLVEIKKPS